MNWSLAHSGFYQAEIPSPGLYLPIPPIDLPVSFSSNIFAIKATSINALKHWRVAGWVNPRLDSGLFGGFDADFMQNIKIYLGRNQIIKLPINEKYSMTYIAPHWIFDISLAIWEYQGEDLQLSEHKPILSKIEKIVQDISDFNN